MATKYWNSSSGDWNNPANWTPVGVPGPDDLAAFDTGSIQTYAVSGSGAAGTLADFDQIDLAGSLVIDNGFWLQGSVTVPAGASLGIGGTIESPLGGAMDIGGQLNDSAADLGVSGLDAFGSGASVVLSGAGANWNTSGEVELRWETSVAVRNGATLSAGNIYTALFTSALTIDTSSTIEGAITLAGVLEADQSSLPGASDTLVINNPITVAYGQTGKSGGPRIESYPGATLDVTGPISGSTASADPNHVPGTPLEIAGTVILANPNNNYQGGTSIQEYQPAFPSVVPPDFGGPSTLILAARGAAGLGAIGLAGPNVALAVESGASGNPDGNTYITLGSGADTVSAVNTRVLAVAGSGTLLFYNGSAPSTVAGSTGSTTIFGGGGGQFFGGTAGNNVIVAGAGAATIGGGGNGDQLWANGAAGDLIAAASGNETLGASGSTGNNVLFGGSGNDLIVAGAGNDVVVAGPGTPTIFAGATGNTAIFAGSGADLLVLGGGADYVQVGSGNATVFAGTGADLFGAANGQAGGNELISGFKNGVDHVVLSGYAGAPAISQAGGSTVITLADNTQITLLGVGRLAANTFV